MTTTPQILTVDHHRNGVGGMGFYVAIVRNPTSDVAGDFLVVSFDDARDDARNNGEPDPGYVNPYLAALRVSDVVDHNIGMYPIDGHPGGAAWRGDRFDSALHDLIRDEHRTRSDARSRHGLQNRANRIRQGK